MNFHRKPVAPAGVPTVPAQGTPATPFPAEASPVLGTGAAREAEARVAPTIPCPDCTDGTTYWLALDATDWEIGPCRTCEGSRVVETVCETCGGELVGGWCEPCCDYGLHTQAMQSEVRL